MSSDTDDHDRDHDYNDDLQQHPDDKGKARAQDATEHTPLLGASSQSYSSAESPSVAVVARRRLRSKLTCIFLLSLSFCILAFVVITVLAWSYASRVSSMSPEELFAASVVFKGPTHVDVLNVTRHDGIWVRVEGQLGVDAGSIVGIHRDTGEDGLFTDIWKSIGQWGVRRLDKLTVQLSTIHITPEYDSSLVLASVNIPPLDVALTPDPPPDENWLTDVSIPLKISPTTNSSAILHFMRRCWTHGRIEIRANVEKAFLRGGALGENSWRKKVRRMLPDVRLPLHVKSTFMFIMYRIAINKNQVPLMPGLPRPGDTFPSVAQLVTLQAVQIVSQNDVMKLQARATIINPAPPELKASMPSLPFTVSLPSLPSSPASLIPIASTTTLPFILTHPNVTLHISGTVLSLPSSSSSILSNFLSRYLSSQPNPIYISSPLLPELSILTSFPGPIPRPQLLRNVTIHDMKIRPTGNAFLASGSVFVHLVLPKGINVALDVHSVFPDVLVADGEVAGTLGTGTLGTPPERPLPDPLPDNVFGHIRPEEWLPSLCVREEPREGDGATYSVSAVITDVPLEVLPNRQKQFSNFVGKVIFGSEGAVAGLLGSASVIVNVEGLPVHGPETGNRIELDGLPFRGNVRIGKKTMLIDEQDVY
ncbi:hypothetical protein AX17_001653 [Amanita inopinata Kibby_2008]|nr:hypothetical protein AX17_001653 [Amanita inopinata Kibby_2008]